MDFYETNDFEVVDLQWERIFLRFDIKTEYQGAMQFGIFLIDRENVNKKEVKKYGQKVIKRTGLKRMIPIEPYQSENGLYRFKVNMSAADGREFLDNAIWKIGIITDRGFSIAGTAVELAYRLDDHARIFSYGRGRYSYNVSFSVTYFNEKNLEFNINSRFMIENRTWKRRRYIQEAFTFRGKLNRTYKYMVIWMIRAFYHVMASLTSKDGSRVLFMSETKGYIWGNLKYIDDRIKERGLDKDFRLTYSCRKAAGEHNSVLSWIKTVMRIARQDYIFVDDYAPLFGFFRLSPKTKLIQVWHAGEGFKSVGYSRFGKEGSPFPSMSCHKAYDYALTGSEKLVEVYEEVFGIEKDAFLPTGMPRLDDFLDRDRINSFRREFYERYPKLRGRKIILFAPTFRGTGQKDAYYDYDKLDLGRMHEFCGSGYAVLFKMHPFIDERIAILEEYQDSLMDFSEYPDINELYYITDMLITDYSSNYYEYALMKKPVLFFTYDRQIYEVTRGVHRSVRDNAPGKVCDTFDELMAALENEDYETDKLDRFIEENFGEYDGHACDRVIDRILLADREV